MASSPPQSVGHGGCSRCGSLELVVHVLDGDPSVANASPDELCCLVCGQAQRDAASPEARRRTVTLAAHRSVTDAIAEVKLDGWSVVMARHVPAGVELVLER